MNSSIWKFFIIHLKMVYRDTSGLFWTIAVPVGLYIALTILPIPNVLGVMSYKNFALPGVIAYVVMQSGVYTLAYWMVELRSRGVIKRFLVTPIKNSELVISLIAARMTVILIQILLITILGVLVFHADFNYNVFSILILALLGSGIFLLVGLLISSAAKSYQSAAPIAMAVAMPSAVLGNLFIPVSVLPHSLQIVASILPITYLSDGLRQAYLYPFNMEILGTDMIVLAVWFVVILTATIFLFKLREE